MSFTPRENFDSDLGCMVYDINNLMKTCKFTDDEKEIIRLSRANLTQEQIAEVLECTQPNIHHSLDRIFNKIHDAYVTSYEKWYYTYIEEGTWKRCSKCGEMKLATEKYFSPKKNSKDGFHPYCKDCRNKNNFFNETVSK